jgi:hypothetical protein
MAFMDFLKRGGGGSGSPPILNSAGEDISYGFAPQADASAAPAGSPSMQDMMGKLGSMFGGGGGGGKGPAFAPPPNAGDLAQLLAAMSQQGGQALAAPNSPPAPGYRMDPNQPVFGRRRFGFGGS